MVPQEERSHRSISMVDPLAELCKDCKNGSLSVLTRQLDDKGELFHEVVVLCCVVLCCVVLCCVVLCCVVLCCVVLCCCVQAKLEQK
jgi:hypothetical protein